jgi:hypothetical protein
MQSTVRYGGVDVIVSFLFIVHSDGKYFMELYIAILDFFGTKDLNP